MEKREEPPEANGDLLSFGSALCMGDPVQRSCDFWVLLTTCGPLDAESKKSGSWLEASVLSAQSPHKEEAVS
ncbi:hypothetical protein E2320_011831 [Naja naja]|nr:hypothetical protein E2320_011831 [Naja naja]